MSEKLDANNFTLVGVLDLPEVMADFARQIAAERDQLRRICEESLKMQIPIAYTFLSEDQNG